MDNNFLREIGSDSSFRIPTVEELTKELDEELAKANPDYDVVDELSQAIVEARGGSVKEVDVESKLKMIKEKANARKRTFKCPKWATAAAVVALLLVGANTVSVAAWDMNIFSAVVQFTKGGFSVDFNEQEQEEITLPTSDEDPYGFIAKLAEYDIVFETPHYIPEGFVLTDVETNVNEEYANSVRFLFHNGEESFSIGYTKYINEVGQTGIPSDHYNISEREVNGSTAIVSKEDNQYTIAYQKGKTVFLMFADKVDYEECEKIVNSIY